MANIGEVINGLEALYDSMHENQCYACSHEFIELAEKFGTEIVADAIEALKAQQEERNTRHDDFFDWLACAVVMDSEWDNNPGFYREVICRKLVRLGVLELKGDEYYLPEPKRT